MSTIAQLLPGENFQNHSFPTHFNTSTEGYGYVFIAAGAISVVQYGLGGVTMGYRKAFKSPEFLKKPEVIALQDEHKRAFGTAMDATGYPDMGSGRYAQLLPYKDWVEFNNAQRGHYNMIEASGPIVTCLVLNGLFQPKVAAGLGLTYAVGRVLFFLGYTSTSGASGRKVGAILSAPAVLGLFGLALYNGLHLIGVV